MKNLMIRGTVFNVTENAVYILAVKYNSGLWNIPYGYVDEEFTLIQNATNIIDSNANLNILPYCWELFDVEETDSNILFNYYSKFNISNDNVVNLFSDIEYVEDVQFIPLSEIDKYEWVDNIENLNIFIREIFTEYYNKVIKEC